MARTLRTGQMATYRDAIAEFINAGKTGTVQEVAAATGCSRQTAYDVLRYMRTKGTAAVHTQIKARGETGSAALADVWGNVVGAPAPLDAAPNTSIVAAAIAARPFFITCWMQP